MKSPSALTLLMFWAGNFFVEGSLVHFRVFTAGNGHELLSSLSLIGMTFFHTSVALYTC